MRILIAGVGNVLRGDDGFGVEALGSLKQEIGGTTDDDVTFYESGIAGIGLVQQLLDGYDALIILDAFDRGAAPGTVFVQEPDGQALAQPGRTREPVDLHQADPEGVLRLAAALGALPRRVWVVGCQVADCDELGAGLSEPVRRAVATAVQRVCDLLTTLRAAARGTSDSV
jgi:hydrogenase maturation protease